MPPLETRTDSPGETPEVPRDPCQHLKIAVIFSRDRVTGTARTSGV